ncbi:TIGR04282 family arsenosugar biosynthesis glycosyltransferase [Alphaproteobacteria bacterium]|nr:TIGR04282 family arsenosugar biosynthesis glycosyltransferase [Alphaproteobacteria bacterium]
MENRSNQLILFAKNPVYGYAKTRLAKEIGFSEANRFYRSLLNDNLRILNNNRWNCWLALSTRNYSRNKKNIFSQFEKNWITFPQISGDISEKMIHAIDRFHFGNIVLVGSDIPNIKQEYICSAFIKLKSHEVVFGPSSDGGFWLIGINRHYFLNKINLRNIFASIRWSTRHTLGDILINCKKSKVSFIKKMTDIDNIQSYNKKNF